MSLPGLHVLVGDHQAARPGFKSIVGDMQERCGPALALHLRTRSTPVRQLIDLAEALEEGAVENGGWLVVNRRLDVALVVGADAVQLGRGALPIEAVRVAAGDSLRVGASVHDLRTADRQRLAGADYLVAGSVYATASHPDRAPAGPVLIERLAPMGLPLIAIGGITTARVREVLAAGATGVAAASAVWDAADPAGAAEDFCGELAAAGH